MGQMRCAGCMQPMERGPVCEHCGHDSRQQNSVHQLPVGTILKGQYAIGKVLGQGGFGITYLGWDYRLNIPVAIKEYYPTGLVMRDCSHSLAVTNCEGSDSNRFESDRQRFLREAQALAKLGNIPEVVRVLGFFPENGTAYIIMEFLRGQTLKQYIQSRGSLTPETVFRLFTPVFRGLERVHAAGLIHRDISPDNIMLLPDGRVKLLDFGAVRSYTEDQQRSTEAILKHGYAPLEQYQRRGTLGPWTDVYALCGTMYYCLTGKVPPDAPERMLYGEGYPWEKIPGLLPHQRDVLEKGTAMLVQDRLPSINALAMGLQMSPDPAPEPEEPSAEDTSASGKQTPRPRRKHMGKLTVLLLAVLLAGGWQLWNRNTEDRTAAVSQPETQPEIQPETTEAEPQPERTEPAEEMWVPQTLERTVDGNKITYTAGDATVVFENGKDMTATLTGLDLPERYPLDFQRDSGQAYLWRIWLHNENTTMAIGTSYYIPVQSAWSGEITLEEMETVLALELGDPVFSCAYQDAPIELTHDADSITWKIDCSGVQGYLLPDGKETPFAFDMEQVTYITVMIIDQRTGTSFAESYFPE